MATKRLTKDVVEELEPRATDYVVWCGKLPGFGCRVRPTGAKSFIAQYRVGGRNTPVRKVTIGSYGKLTVDAARKAASEVLAKAELGSDVAAERAKKRAEMTVAQLCDEYLEQGCALKKASTLASDRGRIVRHIKPLLGRKQIGDITRADIERFMRDVANGKTAVDLKTIKHGRVIVKGGKGTATRTVRLLGGIFTYAVDNGYLATNPRLGVKVYADGKGERFLSGTELQKLGETLREAETVGLPWKINEDKKAKHRPVKEENRREVISPYAIAAIRLMLLTGCRAGEMLNLRWNEVDFDNGLLNLPDSKTGAKKVLLGAPALEILATLPRIGDFVIAGAKPDKPRADIKRPWERVIAHAELHDVRLHDLRHSYASVGAAAGIGLGLVGKLLGHASPTTTARYSHFADDPLRRASDSIASTISAAISAQPVPPDPTPLPARQA
ncbi:site-specific integrase [Phenylobacterium sp.]|uniref:tyrosine-type recombinase/integrase n=1 Tax=Phenylobacterium sp. TaxID=1871053 RepID=UPI002736EB31|nr:site-specific integrase [Phenylobacterium sp.]MDP3659224.1 tyrosine-type recombinase/integrase [Phenylobacterium sp.]